MHDPDRAGRLLLRIDTLRAVAAGEELFLDYALTAGDADPADYRCRCGAARCRGSMLGPAR